MLRKAQGLRKHGGSSQAPHSYAKILLSLAFSFSLAKGMSLGNCMRPCLLASFLLEHLLSRKFTLPSRVMGPLFVSSVLGWYSFLPEALMYLHPRGEGVACVCLGVGGVRKRTSFQIL